MLRKVFQYDESEIINYLKQGKKVYLEYGALNDVITGYKKGEKYGDDFWDDGIRFTTEGNYFGEVSLYAFECVDCEEFNGALFVHIQF